ncbi:hypothetical protein RIF29_36122 [Crotalaria pallida]|uniref:Uncharacterized protein n=1 Tax=Crotalaria pallida TaxID=3830 RepID=A0AAN9EDA0_CROPI
MTERGIVYLNKSIRGLESLGTLPKNDSCASKCLDQHDNDDSSALVDDSMNEIKQGPYASVYQDATNATTYHPSFSSLPCLLHHPSTPLREDNEEETSPATGSGLTGDWKHIPHSHWHSIFKQF